MITSVAWKVHAPGGICPSIFPNCSREPSAVDHFFGGDIVKSPTLKDMPVDAGDSEPLALALGDPVSLVHDDEFVAAG